MGLFENWRRRRRDDWCRGCKCEMEQVREQLFALPGMSVGHYEEHRDAQYYRENLYLVDRKADIPAGMYACGASQYRCPRCGKQVTVLDLFLPVREEEKHEGTVAFANGELDDFLWL